MAAPDAPASAVGAEHTAGDEAAHNPHNAPHPHLTIPEPPKLMDSQGSSLSTLSPLRTPAGFRSNLQKMGTADRLRYQHSKVRALCVLMLGPVLIACLTLMIPLRPPDHGIMANWEYNWVFIPVIAFYAAGLALGWAKLFVPHKKYWYMLVWEASAVIFLTFISLSPIYPVPFQVVMTAFIYVVEIPVVLYFQFPPRRRASPEFRRRFKCYVAFLAIAVAFFLFCAGFVVLFVRARGVIQVLLSITLNIATFATKRSLLFFTRLVLSDRHHNTIVWWVEFSGNSFLLFVLPEVSDPLTFSALLALKLCMAFATFFTLSSWWYVNVRSKLGRAMRVVFVCLGMDADVDARRRQGEGWEDEDGVATPAGHGTPHYTPNGTPQSDRSWDGLNTKSFPTPTAAGVGPMGPTVQEQPDNARASVDIHLHESTPPLGSIPLLMEPGGGGGNGGGTIVQEAAPPRALPPGTTVGERRMNILARRGGKVAPGQPARQTTMSSIPRIVTPSALPPSLGDSGGHVPGAREGWADAGDTVLVAPGLAGVSDNNEAPRIGSPEKDVDRSRNGSGRKRRESYASSEDLTNSERIARVAQTLPEEDSDGYEPPSPRDVLFARQYNKLIRVATGESLEVLDARDARAAKDAKQALVSGAAGANGGANGGSSGSAPTSASTISGPDFPPVTPTAFAATPTAATLDVAAASKNTLTPPAFGSSPGDSGRSTATTVVAGSPGSSLRSSLKAPSPGSRSIGAPHNPANDPAHRRRLKIAEDTHVPAQSPSYRWAGAGVLTSSMRSAPEPLSPLPAILHPMHHLTAPITRHLTPAQDEARALMRYRLNVSNDMIFFYLSDLTAVLLYITSALTIHYGPNRAVFQPIEDKVLFQSLIYAAITGAGLLLSALLVVLLVWWAYPGLNPFNIGITTVYDDLFVLTMSSINTLIFPLVFAEQHGGITVLISSGKIVLNAQAQ